MRDIGGRKTTYILSGTGSSKYGRTEKTWTWLLANMVDVRAMKGPIVVLSGGARGWDYELTLAARHLGIPYELCIPNEGYGAYYWKDNYGAYEEMLRNAFYVEYVCKSHWGINHPKPGGANLDRNDRMVQRADEFLVYDERSPGTSHCVRLIRAVRKPMRECPVSR